MLDLEDYRLNDLFEEVFEAAWRNAETFPATGGDERATTDDDGAPTPPEESLDEDVAEDIGYDEDYSDADNVLYTPTGSSNLDSGEPNDIPLSGMAAWGNERIETQPGDGPSTAIQSGSSSNESSSDSHRSALPFHLMGLPQLTLSTAFAQGRRGSAPAHDDRAHEDPTRHDTIKHEHPVDGLDNNNPLTVVDIVSEYRAIVRDEWDRVFQSDTAYASNPYFMANGWDREALLNYTRFPFRRPSATD
jgi:hypothetical protein